MRAKERAPILYFSAIFCLGLTFESLKELGARHYGCESVGFECRQVIQNCKAEFEKVGRGMVQEVIINTI